MEDQKHSSYGLTTWSAETTFILSPHLSSFLSWWSESNSQQHILFTSCFLPSILQLSAFNSLTPFPFNTQADNTLVKGYVHFRTFSVCSQSDACGLVSSPCTLCVIATQVKQGFPVAGGLFKNTHIFSSCFFFYSAPNHYQYSSNIAQSTESNSLCHYHLKLAGEVGQKPSRSQCSDAEQQLHMPFTLKSKQNHPDVVAMAWQVPLWKQQIVHRNYCCWIFSIAVHAAPLYRHLCRTGHLIKVWQ